MTPAVPAPPRRSGDSALPAVILSGGLGTRLGTLTTTTPKPLATVAGRPVLDWILESLARTGVREVLLLVGHLGQQIIDHVGDGGRWGVRARASVEATPLGTGGALHQARASLPERFLLVYGDSYLPIDYTALSRAFDAENAEAMMVVYEDADRATGVAPNVALETSEALPQPADPIARVATYTKGAGPARLTHIDAGVVALSRRLTDRLPSGRSALETDLYPALAAAGLLRAYVTTQRFWDAGTPDRLRELERALLA